eukprot:PITA_28108
MGERRGNWITALQEFDLEIKPAKIVQGQGLCKLAAEALVDKEGAPKEPEAQSMQNAQVEFREEPLWINETLICERETSKPILDPKSWYYDIHFYLTRGSCPEHMDASRRRVLRLKSNQCHLANDTLYKKNYDGFWLICLERDDVDHVLKEMHDGPEGGHYGRETTDHKILRVGYYWPTVFKDSHAYTQKCKVCQIVAGRERKPVVPLRPVMIYCSFQQWGLDVIKSSNKNLICIIRKFVTDNQRNWHNTLTNTLWADSVTLKVALGNSPYVVVYRQEAILPPNVTLPSLQLSQASRGIPSALLQKRINQLVRLEELRYTAINKIRNHQIIVKRWFDHHLARDKDYQVGELVLKWDKLSEPKGKHTKFQHLWLGPFQVEEKIGQGTYRLKTL